MNTRQRAPLVLQKSRPLTSINTNTVFAWYSRNYKRQFMVPLTNTVYGTVLQIPRTSVLLLFLSRKIIIFLLKRLTALDKNIFLPFPSSITWGFSHNAFIKAIRLFSIRFYYFILLMYVELSMNSSAKKNHHFFIKFKLIVEIFSGFRETYVYNICL